MLISNDATSLARQLDRVGRDLRRLGPGRPSGGRDAGAVADGAHRLAQALADAAADALGEPRRTVPRLGDHALADQVAVTGGELLDSLDNGRTADLTAVAAAIESLRLASR